MLLGQILICPASVFIGICLQTKFLYMHQGKKFHQNHQDKKSRFKVLKENNIIKPQHLKNLKCKKTLK